MTTGISRARELADDAARAWFAVQRQVLVAGVAGEEVQVGDGIVTFVTGAALAVLNGVFTEHPVPDMARLRQAAADFAGRELGLPWCVQVRSREDGATLADAFGAVGSTSEPLMVLERTDFAPAATATAVRVPRPGERGRFRAAVAAGFGLPEEIAELFSSAAVLAMPEVTPYVVSDGGTPVSVGIGVLTHDALGVYSIATVPGHRRRGLARAITERILADGFANGARFAYLHSSENAFALYRSIGFRTVEEWTYALFE